MLISENIFEISPFGVFITDLNGNYIDINNKALELSGYSREEILKLNIKDLIVAEHLDLGLKYFNETIVKGSSDFEIKYYKKNKEIGWWNIKSVFNKDSVVGYVEEISIRKKTIQNLEHDTELYSSILKFSFDSFWIVDVEGTIIDINDSYINLIKFNRDEIIGKKVFDFDAVESEIDSVERINFIKNNINAKFRTKHRAKDGLILDVEISVHYVAANSLFYVFIKDISEDLKRINEIEELNQRFEIAIESGNIGIWDYNYQNNYLKWNDAMYNIFEVEKDSFNFKIEDWENLVHPDDLEATSKNLNDAVKLDQLYNTTFRSITPKGNLKYNDAYGKLIKDRDGNAKMISGVNIDITESILKQQELQKAKDLAEENDKLKTAFLHNISHEIRTPLNGIIGFTHFLTEDGISKEEKKEFETMIKNSTTRLIQVIEDIIDLSMVETGQIVIEKQLFDLNGIMDDVFVLYKERIEKKGIKFKYSYDSSKSVNIYTDSKYLLKILSHLIHNSLKFTNQGEIAISFEIIDNRVRFLISDTGIGIDDNIKEKIYNRFVQGENEANRNYEGAGLGLTLCKELIELLNGNIWFETEKGKGTKFYFELPIKENSEDSILIVEDSDIDYSFLKFLLKKWGIEPIRATNGKEAIDMCDSHFISLILMDMVLPQLNGYEATEIIRSKYKNIPIIAVSSNAVKPLIEKAMKAGCNSHISKPIDADALLMELKKYMDLKL